jgi:hypothetical protein
MCPALLELPRWPLLAVAGRCWPLLAVAGRCWPLAVGRCGSVSRACACALGPAGQAPALPPGGRERVYYVKAEEVEWAYTGPYNQEACL